MLKQCETQDSRRQKCWEYMRCGREEGGAETVHKGICRAYPNHGHCCAQHVGTLGEGDVTGVFAVKMEECLKCCFYKSRNYKPESEP